MKGSLAEIGYFCMSLKEGDENEIERVRKKVSKRENKMETEGRGGGVVVPAGLFFYFFIISLITVVGVQLKATNSKVLILASKEDKDK